jgi:maltokinase
MDVATQLALLPEDELLAFATSQRWFGAKSREAVGLRLLDHAILRSEAPLLVEALAEIRYHAGTHDVYQLLIGLRETGADGPGEPIAEVDGWTGYDALGDGLFGREVIHLVRSGATVSAQEGTVEFHTLGPSPQNGAPPREIRPLGLEQSNSSLVLDDELIVKAYRRIEAGINPELELLTFLTRRGFANIAELHGWWSYSGPPMSATLGIVQRYVRDAVDGWTLALREIPTEPEAFLGRLRRLGEVVGTMHSVLASDPDDPAFFPEQPSGEALALLTATIDEEIQDVFVHLPDNEALAPIAGRSDEIRDVLRGLAHLGSFGRLIRHHGDLHLGQTLWADGDWVLVDFDGEPARTVPERRRKRSALRDVAGKLRTFSYAASAVELEHGGPPPAGFEERARGEFLAAYLDAAGGAGVLPDTEQGVERLIAIFELEKAVYELRYELNNRPDWVGVPVLGILRLLEAASR